MIVSQKEIDACKKFNELLEALVDEDMYVTKFATASSIVAIQVDANRVIEKGMRPNGDIISILDLERLFDRYHNNLKKSILKLHALEGLVINARQSINKLMSDNFSICHACKGRKGLDVVIDNQPDFEECVMCDGRGVLNK